MTERRVRSPQLSTRPNAVFSYHANRSVRETSQQREALPKLTEPPKRKPRVTWLARTRTLAALVGIILIAGLMLQLDSSAKVVPLSASSGSDVFLRDQHIYSVAAQKEFSSLLNSNKLTVDTGKIASDLRQQFPELKAISISLPIIGDKPVVYIQPAIPKIILSGKNGMFVLDADGRALISGSQAVRLQQLGLAVVTDQSGLSLDAGRIVLPGNAVSFITEVIGQLQTKGLKPSSLVLPQGTNELYVTINGAGYQIKFNLHGDARAEAGTFLATKQFLDGQHKTPSQYVDVRVDDKAYYK